MREYTNEKRKMLIWFHSLIFNQTISHPLMAGRCKIIYYNKLWKNYRFITRSLLLRKSTRNTPGRRLEKTLII